MTTHGLGTSDLTTPDTQPSPASHGSAVRTALKVHTG